MASKKENELRKLKRSYVGGSVFGLLVIGVLIFAVFASMLSMFALYIMDSKLRDEYARSKNMAHLYLLSQTAGNDAVISALDEPDNDYIIVGDDGKIVKEHGNNTCDLSSGGRIDILGIDPDEEIHHIGTALEDVIIVYPDTQLRAITPGIGGRVGVDFEVIFETVFSHRTDAAVLSLSQSDFVKLPFWIDVPLRQGLHMVCKANFVIYFRELAILGILALNIVLLTVVLLVFLIIFLVRNLRNRKRMNRVFFMDETTGMHNWLWFLTNAERELKKRANSDNKYAVLDIVFVNYRNFCVCHSIAEGEQMLVKVQETIENCLEKKEMAAHHSAAHFAALMIYNDEDELRGRIEDMVGRLEKINDEHKFSFWVGVDRVAGADTAAGRTKRYRDINIENEYNNAGAARATITGDDSAIVFFGDEMVEEQKWIDMINENQQKALDNEEYLVYYQPKYDPRTRQLKGAEALIRWNSPEHGMISPGRFIPIFEKNGFITKIDHYMLKHVAKDQRTWLDQGLKCVPVSVNVSRAHFIESDLAEQIRDIVDEAKTPHELIEIELTESAFFDDKNALIDTIRKLKEYGFTVSMDDFGSGYSSLNSLKEMPLDVLKLDADFFRNEGEDGRGQIVVEEAIRLAKNLNMRTVAEGVEVEEQVDFLAEHGCDLIQGFYFAKPMPKDEYVERLS